MMMMMVEEEEVELEVVVHDEEAWLLVTVATAVAMMTMTKRLWHLGGRWGKYLCLLHSFGSRVFSLMPNFSNGGGDGGGKG